MLDLSTFRNDGFDRGASRIKELLWLVASGLLVDSWVPGSGWRVRLLRLFGAKIDVGVVIKPNVQIKFPWRLSVGANAWIGERVWIDNLAQVNIGANACVSQGVYLCTGSHDYRKPSFDLVTSPIDIGEGAWVTAFCRVAPGTRVPAHYMTRFSTVVTNSVVGTGTTE